MIFSDRDVVGIPVLKDGGGNAHDARRETVLRAGWLNRNSVNDGPRGHLRVVRMVTRREVFSFV